MICSRRIWFSGVALAFLAAPAVAENLSVVGSWSSLTLHKEFETKFWNEVLPAAANGELAVRMTTFDQMGLKGSDVFRMLGDGLFDVGMSVGDHSVEDAPELEGLDVPLVANTAQEAKKMVDAARPLISEVMEERFNAKLLAIAPYPPQIVFCRTQISSLADLKGKKVRGSGRMTSQLLEALGAEGITLAFGEVTGALERGVVDCAVTGGGSGYSAGWWEVSKYLMPLPLGGWDPVITAVNLDKWTSLSPELQQLILDKVRTDFEDPAWSQAERALRDDVACLTGNGECPVGTARDMLLIEPTPNDVNMARNVLSEKVLPDWANRVGRDWVSRWNDSVGAIVGVKLEE